MPAALPHVRVRAVAAIPHVRVRVAFCHPTRARQGCFAAMQKGDDSGHPPPERKRGRRETRMDFDECGGEGQER